MPKTIELQVPAEYEDQLKQEMEAAALAAFKAVAGRQRFAEYMNRKTLSEYLGVSAGTVDKLKALGMPTITVDTLLMFKRSEVDKFLLSYQL